MASHVRCFPITLAAHIKWQSCNPYALPLSEPIDCHTLSKASIVVFTPIFVSVVTVPSIIVVMTRIGITKLTAAII